MQKQIYRHVLFLGADISDNSLGRVWILADMLSLHAHVTIAGASSRGGVWAPLAGNTAHTVHMLPSGRFAPLSDIFHLWRYVRRSKADIIYICKPKFPPMVAALLGGRGRRLVLDNDDWEAGCARGSFSRYRFINWLAARGVSFTQIADWIIPLIKRRTVSNVFLQSRYGGAVIPHARNEDAFANIVPVRQTFGLPEDRPIVMFFGTPHRHKGVALLIEAMQLTKNKDHFMVVAGIAKDMPEYTAYADACDAALSGRYAFLPFVPWVQAPQLLACADILVVPQMATPFTRWGQTPAKVFDAMAAGKPLVVSDIADTSQIVGDAAWLVAPDNAQAIADALDAICADPDAAQAKAKRLHERFLRLYSYAKVAPLLAREVLSD